MTLTELSAFEAAYQVLAPLDETARRRALQWLSDVLGDHKPLAANPSSVNGTTTAAGTAPTVSTSQTAKPVTRRRNAATSKTSTAATTTATTRGRKRKATGKTGGRAATATVDSGREYRRMPDPDEVMNAYHEVGTVSGLAEHFDVPQHTVIHWARRLRSLGYHIGRNA